MKLVELDINWELRTPYLFPYAKQCPGKWHAKKVSWKNASQENCPRKIVSRKIGQLVFFIIVDIISQLWHFFIFKLFIFTSFRDISSIKFSKACTCLTSESRAIPMLTNITRSSKQDSEKYLFKNIGVE